MSVRRLILTVMVALLSVAGLVAAPAWGVELTDDTQPYTGQTLTVSPATLILVFDEPLSTTPGVVMQSQNDPASVIKLSEADRGDDPATWIVTVQTVLPPGTYRVLWSTQTFNGEYSFSIGQAVQTGVTALPTTAPGVVVGQVATTATTAAPAVVVDASATTVPTTDATSGTKAETSGDSPGSSSSSASALGVIARWLSTLGLAAVFGGLLLIARAWPEGVEYVITSKYLRAAWIMALAATVVLVIATRASGTGEGLGSSISPIAWFELRNLPGGSALLLRLVFVAATGWVVLVPERIIDESTQVPGFAAPVLALLTFGFSRVGEAGGGVIGIAASIVHALSFAAWIGGVALLARVVLIGPGEEDLLHAVRGFRRIAGPALIGVVASGLLRAIELSGGGTNLLNTGYGRRLLIKLALFAALVYVGLMNRQTIRDRLGRANRLGARAASRLRRALSAELLTGVVVMLLGSWMVSGAAPGVAASSSVERVKVVTEVKLQDTGVDVTIGAAPAAVGANTVLITVRKPVTGLVSMLVTMTPANGLAAGIEVEVTSKLDGKGVMRLDGVPFGTGGVWNVTVVSSDLDGALPSVAGNFDVTDPAAVVPSVDPNATAVDPNATAADPNPAAVGPAPTTAPPTVAAGGAAIPTPATTPNP